MKLPAIHNVPLEDEAHTFMRQAALWKRNVSIGSFAVIAILHRELWRFAIIKLCGVAFKQVDCFERGV